MPIDRDAALKRAEKCLRQGKLDGAIEEYLRLVEEQPRDWSSINALGDLYVRAGNGDRAVEQFHRVADFLFDEGFLPKAQAVYKKALKVHSTHEHTLLRLAEIAARQEVFVDARLYLRQLGEQRRFRGDTRGVAECIIKAGLLDDADTPAKLAAAQAAEQIGDPALAGRLLADPTLALAQAARELDTGRYEEALQRIGRVVMQAPQHAPEVMQLGLGLLDAGGPERAFACIDIVVDAALLEGDLGRAADALRTFVSRAPHIPALAKLVDVCVDAGLEAETRDAQAQLADAYRAAGREAEAQAIADDLAGTTLAGDLVDEGFFDDLGTPDRRPGAESPPVFAAAPDAAPASLASVPPPPATEAEESPDDAIVIEVMEIDLSETLGGLEAAPVLPPVRSEPAPPPDLESVFEEMRAAAGREQQGDAAATQFAAGHQYLQEGRRDEAVAAFQAAARVPPWRFRAGAQLARLYLTAGDLPQAIEWFERAAEAPAPSADEGTKLLYDLAGALEAAGESARALAVLLELNADAPGYRDIGGRIDRLSRAQAGSPSS